MNDSSPPSSFIPYPSYKDSGVAWLGDVPKHWEIHPNRALFYERNKKNNPEMELLSVTITKGVIRQKELISNTSKKDSSNEDKSKYKLVKQGDIAYNKMRMWQGAVGASKYEGIVSPAYIIVHPRDGMDEWFYHYLFRSPKYIKESHRYSYGICDDQLSLRIDDFKRIFTPKPPLGEQRQTVKFLDHKTAQIARFIKAKKRMIELLKEQKQVIINDAVTGKIVIKDEGGRLKAEKRPDASFIPHPSLFLQTVPEGWEVKPLKHLVRFNLEALSEKTGADYSFQYLDIGSVKTGYIIKQPENLLFEKSPSRARRIVKQGDTILSTVRTYLRSVFYISSEVKDLIVSTGFAVLTPNNAIAPRYLGYVVQCDQFINRVIQNSIGVSYPAISETKLGTLLVGFPVLLTQQLEILKYIENKTAALDLAISRTEREIALMQEYRTRLISDVVTGKIDVRDIEIPDIAGIDDTIDESIDEPEGEEELETAEVEE